MLICYQESWLVQIQVSWMMTRLFWTQVATWECFFEDVYFPSTYYHLRYYGFLAVLIGTLVCQNLVCLVYFFLKVDNYKFIVAQTARCLVLDFILNFLKSSLMHLIQSIMLLAIIEYAIFTNSEGLFS